MYLIPISCDGIIFLFLLYSRVWQPTSYLVPQCPPFRPGVSMGWVCCALCQHRLLVVHAGNWNRGRGEPLVAQRLGGLPYKPVFNCLEERTLGQRARNSLYSPLS